ncbi:G/U mismatch-specific uracil-DNA glycosylase [Williamsia muralis]|uniref:G/U mismatch-specific uracil-DNA glycosylase n=1 Tax=Williamsia marianensis TaxID=85044 RepID=A0A495KBL0_WILMA|nr:G/U mismatch-specific DNA glycosylase [Williamsia muralis]RKR97964.1 G/U mismatch-specific uracil-DNA glycosylase [Williamsia muralis]
MGFTRAELESYRDAVVPDLIGPDCKLLFVGINPGLWTAATGAHFARRGNRFYPALWRAGIVDRLIDASAGMSDDDRALLLDRGIGITNVVPRASARADELTTEELVEGGRKLIETVTRVHPKVIAVAGITAYRTAFGDRKATAGRQDRTIGDTVVWVVPNPSGLNAHHTVDTLAEAYRAAAVEAGVVQESRQ